MEQVRNEMGTVAEIAAGYTPGGKVELPDETRSAQVVISGVLESRPPEWPQAHIAVSKESGRVLADHE